jgi:hypothetical protein
VYLHEHVTHQYQLLLEPSFVVVHDDYVDFHIILLQNMCLSTSLCSVACLELPAVVTLAAAVTTGGVTPFTTVSLLTVSLSVMISAASS